MIEVNGVKPAFLTLHGSRGYGLETLASDEDYRGYFFLPPERFFGLNQGPDTIDSIKNGQDIAIWEFRKFMRLVGNSNPNVIETIFTDPKDWVVDENNVVRFLAQNKHLLLSKKIHRTFGGYAYQQFQKLGRNMDSWQQNAGVRKDAMHCARLIFFMREVLEHGTLTVKIDPHKRPDMYNHLMAIRRGQLKVVSVYEWARQELEACDRLAQKSTIREEPDLEFLNKVTTSVLRERYNVQSSVNT
jgi:predicted nucleotidyltransferase